MEGWQTGQIRAGNAPGELGQGPAYEPPAKTRAVGIYTLTEDNFLGKAPRPFYNCSLHNPSLILSKFAAHWAFEQSPHQEHVCKGASQR